MVTIRPERPDDADAVAGVHVRAWQSAYAGIMPAEVLDRLRVPAWAERRRLHRTADDDATFLTLVATDDADTVVGFVTLGSYRVEQNHEELDPAFGEILAIYLEPVRVATGVGRELMAAALAELSRRGYTTVRLWVLEDNHRARRFYERAGFKPDGERSTYEIALTNGRGPARLDEIRYVASVGPGS